MPRESSVPDEKALRELVLGYLEEHPQAMETLEGIAEWWIDRRMIRVDVEALSHVLEILTAQGVLGAEGSGEARRYRLGAAPHKGHGAGTATRGDAEKAPPAGKETLHVPVTLTNRSEALVTLELNTGSWIHLAPGETSRRLEDYEVRDNRYVRKLTERRLVTMTTITPGDGALPLRHDAKPSRSKKAH